MLESMHIESPSSHLEPSAPTCVANAAYDGTGTPSCRPARDRPNGSVLRGGRTAGNMARTAVPRVGRTFTHITNQMCTTRLISTPIVRGHGGGLYSWGERAALERGRGVHCDVGAQIDTADTEPTRGQDLAGYICGQVSVVPECSTGNVARLAKSHLLVGPGGLLLLGMRTILDDSLSEPDELIEEVDDAELVQSGMGLVREGDEVAVIGGKDERN